MTDKHINLRGVWPLRWNEERRRLAMRFAALGFALGVCLLQKQPVLPGAMWLTACFAFAAIAAIGFSRRVSPVIAAGATFVGFAALGFAWAAAFAHLRLSDRLGPAPGGGDGFVTGVVACPPP